MAGQVNPMKTPSPLTILVELRDQYGKQVAHPVCDNAKTFAAIAGTTSLTNMALHNIKFLGYTINVKQKEINL